MIEGPGEMENSAFVAWRGRVARALAAAMPALDASDAEHGVLRASFGTSRLALRLVPIDTPRVFLRFETIALAYAIEGSVADHADEARRLVVAAVGHLRAIDSLRDVALAALVGPIVARHQERVRDWHRGSPLETPDYVPPCLAMELRPAFASDLARPSQAERTTPCGECAVADGCPRPANRSDPAPEGLRPLRHRDRRGAALAALRSLATTFDCEIPDVVTRCVDALLDAPTDSSTPTPFEMSVKVLGRELLPAFRIVEYAPRPAPGVDVALFRKARLGSVIASARPLLTPEAERGLDAWLAILAARAPHALELSIGLDVSVPSGQTRVQIYAHVDSLDRDTAAALVLDGLAFSGISDEARAPFAAMLLEDDRIAVLLCLAPTEDDARRAKVYLAAPLTASHSGLGLLPCAPMHLAPFAPDMGLAVFETDRGTLRFRKWDFPNTAHFQHAGPSVDAFVEGLSEDARARLERLFDGRHFAPWPTWLSVGGANRTYYFVPR